MSSLLRNRKLLFLAMLVCMAVGYFWQRSGGVQKTPVLIHEEPVTAEPSVKPDIPQLPVKLETSRSLAEVQKCFKEHLQLKAASEKSDFQLQDLKSVKAEKATFDKINVHFNSQGKSYRVMLLNEQGGEGANEKVNFFEVEDDGYPTRRDLPEEWKNSSPLEVLKDIKNKNQITMIQKNIRWQIDPQTHMNFVDENGRLQELMVILKDPKFGTRMLGCKLDKEKQIKCACLESPQKAQ